MGSQRHAQATLLTGKTRYPLYRRLGGPQGRYGRVRKISPPLGFDPRTMQTVASSYKLLFCSCCCCTCNFHRYCQFVHNDKTKHTNAVTVIQARSVRHQYALRSVSDSISGASVYFENRLLASLYLSASPRRTTGLPLDGFKKKKIIFEQ